MSLKNFLICFCVIITQQMLPISLAADSATELLKGRLDSANPRYKTFAYALKLMKQRNVKTIIETGTTRGVNLKDIFSGDGGSTILFADWASKNGAFFYSVDIEAQAFKNSAKFLDPYRQYVKLVVGDSVAFLQNFKDTIDMLYLDSYDFEANNPGPSQEHHLKEIIAAMPNLTDDSIILMDDCGLPHGGKGKLAIQYLQNLGWKVVMQGYQVLLLKND